MWSDLFLLVLTALVALAQALDGQPPWVMLFFFSFFGLMLLLRERQNRRRREFLDLLRCSRQALMAGGTVMINDRCIRYNTALVTYKASVGALFSSVTICSRYHHLDEGRSHEAVALNILSLMSGWWSPTGPLHTLACLKQNFAGGEKQLVSELCTDLKPLRKKRLETSHSFHTPSKESLRLSKPFPSGVSTEPVK